MSDFNIDTLHLKYSIPSEYISYSLSSNGYSKLISKPTREASSLDNIYTNYYISTDICVMICVEILHIS